MRIDWLLAAFAAGELGPAERAEVRVALATTPALHADLARYRRLMVLLAVLAAHDLHAPDDLPARIARRLSLWDTTP